MFDDDWEASTFLYPRDGGAAADGSSRPCITLLVVAVGDNIIFDPAKEELAVAETALAVSVAEVTRGRRGLEGKAEKRGTMAEGAMDVDVDLSSERDLRLLSIRMIDPPSRLTPPGVPDVVGGATAGSGGSVGLSISKHQQEQQQKQHHKEAVSGVWKAPLGGTKFSVVDNIIKAVLAKGGVVEEVLDGLEGVELA